MLPAAVEALTAGRLAEFGALVDRSQSAAEELLGNQVPETSRWRALRANSARTRHRLLAPASAAVCGRWSMRPAQTRSSRTGSLPMPVAIPRQPHVPRRLSRALGQVRGLSNDE